MSSTPACHFQVFDRIMNRRGDIVMLNSIDRHHLSSLLNRFFATSLGRPTFVIGNGWTRAAVSEQHYMDKKTITSSTIDPSEQNRDSCPREVSYSWEAVMDEALQHFGVSASVYQHANSVQKAELLMLFQPDDEQGQQRLLELKNKLATNLSTIRPSLGHRFLSTLIHARRGHVVTTNYDCVLDHAILFPDVVANTMSAGLQAECKKASSSVLISVNDAVRTGSHFIPDQILINPPLRPDTDQIILHKIHGSFHQHSACSSLVKSARNRYHSPPDMRTYDMGIVLSEREYRWASARLMDPTHRRNSSLLLAMTSFLIISGKGMYLEDTTPIAAMNCTSRARAAVFADFLQSEPESIQKWANELLPNHLSGIYFATSMPSATDLTTLLTMGFLTIMMPEVPVKSELYHGVANILSLAALFPNEYDGFLQQESDAGNPFLPVFQAEADRLVPQPAFVAMGVSGDGTFIDLGDTSSDSSDAGYISDQAQVQISIGPAMTAARVAAALFANQGRRVGFTQQCALVTVFPRSARGQASAVERMHAVCEQEQIITAMTLPEWQPEQAQVERSKSMDRLSSIMNHITMDGAAFWRQEPTWTSRKSLWATTYLLNGRGDRTCMETDVPYFMSQDDITAWCDRLRSCAEKGMLNKTRLIYLDRLLFQHRAMNESSRHLLSILFQRTLQTHSDKPSPDGLLETGNARDLEEFRCMKDYCNIVTMGWTFFTRCSSIVDFLGASPASPAMTTLYQGTSTTNSLLRSMNLQSGKAIRENEQIGRFVHIYEQYQSNLTAASANTWFALLNAVAQVARAISKPQEQSRRHWCILTLRQHGALCLDLQTCHYYFDRNLYAASTPSYPVLAGNVFRGAFAAAFCSSETRSTGWAQDVPTDTARLVECTQYAVWCASKKVTMFNPIDYFAFLRSSPIVATGAHHRIVMLGSGALQLTTAIVLLNRGVDVCVLTDSDGPPALFTYEAGPQGRQLESSAATAAFWMPFIPLTTSVPRGRFSTEFAWAAATYERWREIESLSANEPNSDLKHCLLKACVTRVNCTLQKLRSEWLSQRLEDLLKGANLREITHGNKQAVSFDTYIVEPRHYLRILEARFTHQDGTFGQLKSGVGLTASTAETLARNNPQHLFVNFLPPSEPTQPSPFSSVKVHLLLFEKYPASFDLTMRTPQIWLHEDHSPDTLAFAVCYEECFVLGGTRSTASAMDPSFDPRSQILRNCGTLLGEPWMSTIAHMSTEERQAGVLVYGCRIPANPHFEFDNRCENLFHSHGHSSPPWTLCWGNATATAEVLLERLQAIRTHTRLQAQATVLPLTPPWKECVFAREAAS